MVRAGPDEKLFGGMPVRPPVDALRVGELLFVFAVDSDDINLQPFGLFAVAAKNDPLLIGRNERAAVIAGGIRDLTNVRAVGIHQIDVGVAVAIAAKGDELAVFGIDPFGVVAGRVGQAAEDIAVEIGFEEVHVRIEVPFVAAADAGFFVILLLLAFGGLSLIEMRVEMARGEENPLAIGREIAAGSAAAAGADALGANGSGHGQDASATERLRVNLIKRIVERLGLIDDLLAVGREV